MSQSQPINPAQDQSQVLYTPPQSTIESTRTWAFLQLVEERYGVSLKGQSASETYTNLHRWSVENIGDFHSLAWEFCGLLGDQGAVKIKNADNMLEAKFFPDGKISFAENMLKQAAKIPNEPAIMARIAGGADDRVLSWKELYDEVSRWEQVLENAGIGEGDRISTYLPHIPEAYIIHIAASNLGTIFSSVGTEMGAEATADRFRQIQPKLLITIDGYIHATPKGNREENRLETIKELQDKIDGLSQTIVIPNLEKAPDLSKLSNTSLSTDILMDVNPRTIQFKRRDFCHPLAILFSSGSTGTPKCFVHGTGNILLKHAIEHQLNSDVREGDREFYHTTTSWMMFNWLAGSLAQGASILIYEGNPAYPDASAQLDFCSEYGCTHLGTAAGVVQDVWRANKVDMKGKDLSDLRALSYTASVLSAGGYQYIHDNIKADMSINGICGGTDFVGCYAAGNPFMPTVTGELKGPVLGMTAETWNDDMTRTPLGEVGELVITKPFISRPLYFWADQKSDAYPHGERFTESYFTHFENAKRPVWRHGDAVRLLANGQLIIEGRSDSTLNQNGVRIGSQMLYDALENNDIKPLITDSMAVNFKDAEGGDHTILFIVPAQNPDQPIDEQLKLKIKSLISDKVGRLCVPHEIMTVPYILKTPNGKKVEKPTKQALAGQEIATPETYGTCPKTGEFKAKLFEKIGQDIKKNPKYGFKV
ncbi:MAG: acetoacetate--CoA ligase [Micavibrio sp.]|nr:acetoacetate--CoA ligase [Micavibrio sp.]